MLRKKLTAEQLDLERRTHDAITQWVENHVQRSTSGTFGALPYDPKEYPYQRLTEPYMPPKHRPFFYSRDRALRRIEEGLAQHLGSTENANAMIDRYQNTAAGDGSGLSIAEDVERRIENQEGVTVITDHLEKEDLRDIVLVIAGLIRATGNVDLRERAAILMGKNISRESYRGVPVAKATAAAAGIIWVMQDTDSRHKLPIPAEADEVINRGGIRKWTEMRMHGALFGVVPSGTAMRRGMGAGAEERYVRPEVSETTIRLLSTSDAMLPTGFYKHSPIKGGILTGPILPSVVRKDTVMVESALERLAQHDADLTGLPVDFVNFDGSELTAEPHFTYDFTNQ